MNSTVQQGEKPARIALLTGLLAGALGGSGLVGWVLDIPVLKSVLPWLVTMKGNTALEMLLCGVALSFLSRGKASAGGRACVTGIAVVVVSVGVLTLAEYFFGMELGIDQTLFRDTIKPVGMAMPGRMSPSSAFCFVLVGVSLLTAVRPLARLLRLPVLEGMGSAIIVVGGFALVGYILDAVFHYRGWSYTGMAINTAAGFILLGSGLLALARSEGVIKWSVNALTFAGFAAGIGSLLAAAGISYHFVEQLQQSAALVSRAQEVIRKIDEVTTDVATMGSVQRSYINTGNEPYLEQEAAVKDAIHRNLDDFRKLAADTPHQQERLSRLEALISRRIEWGEQTVDTRRKGGLPAAERIIATGAGITLSGDIRSLIKEMEDEEYSLLDQRQKSEQTTSTNTFLLLPLGVFLSITLLSLGLFFLNAGEAERKRAEASVARLAAIVEFSDDAIIGKDLGGIVTSWNAGAEKLFGYPAGEMIGQPITRLIPPARMQEEGLILGRIQRGESVQHFDTERLCKDGRVIPISVTVSPIKDSTGQVTGASKVARDISERKQADDKLRAQLSRLDLLSQTTRAMGDRQDLQSIFQVVVGSLENSLPVDFGCICRYDVTKDALTVACVGAKSQPLALELSMSEQTSLPIDQNGLSRCIQGKLVYEPDISAVKFPFPQRLAQAKLHSLVAAPLLVEGHVFGILVAARREARGFSSPDCEFLRQLSEHLGLAVHQSQLYNALSRAYEDLRQTQQAVLQQERLRVLGQMASGIAHDINNAISPVAIYAETLLESERSLSPRGRESLETIRRAIDDVAATVARMREFYREREPQLTLAAMDLNQLAQQVADLTRARWSDMPQQRGIVIEMRKELAPDLPLIMGVESEIREALTNLIFNAVDAMPAGGILALRTRAVSATTAGKEKPARPALVQFEVSDTGVGMDEETRRRCLEPFFTTKGERGTGLGLAMVYGMVRRHSAELEIESAVGNGTTMRLSFAVPVNNSLALAQAFTPAAVPSRLRILIVDDDPVLLKSLWDALEMDGHFVTAAHGGQEGIETFRAAQEKAQGFAAVITDLGMPRVDGRQVASGVKIASPSTPVILLTGWGQRLVAEGDLPPHVDRVLGKPPKLREVREALAHFCPAASA